MEPDRATERRARMIVRRFNSNAEADAHDLEYWSLIPESDRALVVWQLSLEQHRLSGAPAHEPGLCRSVASLRRR